MASDPVRWIRRAIVGGIVVIGWVFIAWQNKFHVTAPVFFLCMGYLAVVLTTYNLWRTGASAMEHDQAGDEAWSRPLGERGELEKEKKTLLKAIKEAEFDHQMGKLSKSDADAMIATYRARAIEVIKELERFENLDMAVDPAGRPIGRESVRDQIAREVKARLELAVAAKSKKKKPEKGDKPDGKAEAKAEKAEAKADTREPETAATAVEPPPAEPKAAEPKAAEPKAAEPKAAEPKVDVAEAAAEAKPEPSSEATEATS